MKIKLKELKGILRRMLVEAKEKKEKEPFETGFKCPKHDLDMLPFFIKTASKEEAHSDVERLKPFKYIQPTTAEHPELAGLRKFVEKTQIKFYYCPLRKEPGRYGETATREGVECDYIIKPMQTAHGKEFYAYGDVARELGLIGVPVKRMMTKQWAQVVGKDGIPKELKDELERMEKGGYRWKRIKGEKLSGKPGYSKWAPDKWVRIPAESKKAYSGDDEHFLSYPYPMMLAKQKGQSEPAYYFSRDKVARALIALGWNIVEPATKERKVTPPSMPEKSSAGEEHSSLSPGWYEPDEDENEDEVEIEDDTEPEEEAPWDDDEEKEKKK
jgi:hypothetical protein